MRRMAMLAVLALGYGGIAHAQPVPEKIPTYLLPTPVTPAAWGHFTGVVTGLADCGVIDINDRNKVFDEAFYETFHQTDVSQEYFLIGTQEEIKGDNFAHSPGACVFIRMHAGTSSADLHKIIKRYNLRHENPDTP